ncbi:MAG: chorismate mutase [Chloroflexi bacterium]|nr:chorismate mutase [Chloroflexota bacterium]
MKCRGVRGATTVEGNTREHILAATKELLQEMVIANGVEEDDIACIIFTTTPDLNAEFPAVAARELGFSQTAFLCEHEMNVPDSLSMCLRILLLFNTEKHAHELVHVYLKGAQGLRAPKTEEKGEM